MHVTLDYESNELCKIASKYIGQEVICKRFEDLRESNTYDAVWACASLLHVPLVDLSKILSKVKITEDVRAGGGRTVVEFKDNTVTYVVDGVQKTIEADTVAIAAGYRSCSSLYDELQWKN